MKLRVVCVGRPGRLLAPPIAEYEARVRRYFDLDVAEVKSGRGDPDRVRRIEGAALSKRVGDGGRVWALTREGRRFTSKDLASALEEVALYGSGAVTWVIGGAFGLDRTLLDASERLVSLSDLTLPHEIARLVLAEQLYRAGTILRGEPYHKGG